MPRTQSRPSSERLLTRWEVAEVFNVAPRTVTAWARSGRFPSTRTPGGQYRFRESDVTAQMSAYQPDGE
ncbi:helix-turn-helix domain-containing protein [Nonomuraea sp. NPDC049714]|uniref:helix-turn-helix domain-containing protein n=1 Tax=Nonomuraea sp. NPDC049714 TaxID=3364357 RepID=UPI0037A05A4D